MMRRTYLRSPVAPVYMSPIGAARAGVVSGGGDAVPDSEADQKLVHRYVLDDVNGTVEDSVGNADGTVNGVTSVSGDYAGGSAGDGDGTDDYIELTSAINTWFSNLESSAALAFTVDNFTADSNTAFGSSDGNTNFYQIRFNPRGEASGKIGLDLRNGSDTGDEELTYANGDTNINDGNPYRIVFNWPSGIDSTGDSDVEIWINQGQESISVLRSSAGTGSLYSPSYVPYLFALNNTGSANNFSEPTLDDVCFFDDSLTQSEIESYVNPWE